MSNLRKCCICDGQIVNGRCVECGMRMTDESREANLNVGSQKTENMKQRAETADRADRHEYKKWVDTQGQKAAKGLHPYKNQKNKAGNKKNLNVIKIVSILVVVITVVIEAFQEYRFDAVENVADLGAWFTEESVVEDERNPYEYVTRELAAEGESYEISLGTGFYEVGVQIPEGNYTLTAEVDCNIDLSINDSENYINLWESFSYLERDYCVDELSDVRLYSGAKVRLLGSGSLLLVSENAQTQSMAEMVENPMKEVVTIKTDKEKRYVAGMDFPEGTYDISIRQGDIGVDLYEESEDKYSVYFSLSTNYGTTTIHNVEFSVGDDLNISMYSEGEEVVLELIPTSVVPAPIESDMEDTV